MSNELKPVSMDELVFFNIPLQDRVNTKLELLDTDWMSYTLSTRFPTKNQGILDVEIVYAGGVESEMIVEQDYKGIKKKYTYWFDTAIFEKHITKFMKAHLAHWKELYAFYGGELVIAFYNEIIDKGVIEGE